MNLVQDVLVMRSKCTLISHDDLKRHPAAFYAQCSFVGLQPDGDGGLLELWNHRDCGSTLAVLTVREVAPDELMVLADRYVAHCCEGDVLAEDDSYYRPFVTHIPAALMKRGLHIEPVIGGWRVCRSPSK